MMVLLTMHHYFRNVFHTRYIQLMTIQIRGVRSKPRSPQLIHSGRSYENYNKYKNLTSHNCNNGMPLQETNLTNKTFKRKTLVSNDKAMNDEFLSAIEYRSAVNADIKLINKCKSRKFREKSSLFLVEGTQLLYLALKARLKPQGIYFTDTESLLTLLKDDCEPEEEKLSMLNGLPLCKIDLEKMHKLPSFITAKYPFGLFEMARFEDTKEYETSRLPLTVILDEIREPGNLGSILRTLSSVAVKNILLMKGCCDPWDIKVLKASFGGTFFINIETAIEWNDMNRYIPANENVFLADLTNEEVISSTSDNEILDMSDMSIIPTKKYDCIDYRTCCSSKNGLVLIVGGEIGISENARKFTLRRNGYRATIPQDSNMNSLNSSVASGILVYEIQRQFSLEKNDI